MDKKQQSLDNFAKAREAGLPDPEKDMAQLSDELAKFYRKYLKELKAQLKDWLELYDQMSFSDQLQVERLLNVANVINEMLEKPAINIQDTIKAHVLKQGENGYNGVWYELEQANNILMDFTVLDPYYLDQLMEEPVAGKRLSKRLGDNVTNLAKASNNAISRGFMMGKGYADIARDISTETQASYNRAVRIARTEGGRVNGLATQKGYEEAADKGIDLQKMWLATLDGRTRSDHGKVDGTIVAIDGNFSVGGYDAPGPHQVGVPSEDINCRCTTRPIVHGIIPTVRRDNITGKVGEWQSYDEWKNSKTFNQKKHKDFQDLVGNWKKKLTKDEEENIKTYTSDTGWHLTKNGRSLDFKEYFESNESIIDLNYADVNSILRKGNIGDYPGLKNIIENIDKGLTKFKLLDNIRVYRNTDKLEFESLVKTGIIKNYLSTSIYQEGLDVFGDYEIEILIPKGNRGAYLASLSLASTESEFLISRNTKYQLISIDSKMKKAVIQLINHK